MMADFDPTRKGLEKYKQSGMSRSAYLVQEARWKRQQMQNQGYQGGISSYTPPGYTPIQSQRSVENPDLLYWKSSDMARYTNGYAPHKSTAPMAVSGGEKRFWDSPQAIGRFHDFLQVQDDDYEPPDWLNKNAVNSAYKSLTDYYGNNDWANWNEIPFGTDASYLTSFMTSPFDQPKLQETPEAVAVVNDYNKFLDKAEAVTQETIKETTAEISAYLQQQRAVSDKTYIYEPEELPDYAAEEPWAQFMLTISSAAKMKNRPFISRFIASGVNATMAGLGGAAIGAGVGSLIAPGPGTAIGGGVGAVAAMAASFIQSFSEKEIPAVAEVSKFFNLLSEATERLQGMAYMSEAETQYTTGAFSGGLSGMAGAGSQLMPLSSESFQNAQKQEYTGGVASTDDAMDKAVATWQAAHLTYETQGSWFMGTSGDAVVDFISKLAHKIDPEHNSGYTTSVGEVWQLAKGFDTPQSIREGVWGDDALNQARDRIQSGEDIDAIYADYVDRFGLSGTLTDFINQTLMDPAQYLPSVLNASAQDVTASLSNKYMKAYKAGDVNAFSKALDAQRFNSALKFTQGDAVVDGLPAPVQMLYQGVLNIQNVVKAKDPTGKFASIDLPKPTMSIFQSYDLAKAMAVQGYMNPTGLSYKMTQADAELGVLTFSDEGWITFKKPDGDTYVMSPEAFQAQYGVTFEKNAKGGLDFYANGVKVRSTTEQPSGTVIDITATEAQPPTTTTAVVDQVGFTQDTQTTHPISIEDAGSTHIVLDTKTGNKYEVSDVDSTLVKAYDSAEAEIPITDKMPKKFITYQQYLDLHEQETGITEAEADIQTILAEIPAVPTKSKIGGITEEGKIKELEPYSGKNIMKKLADLKPASKVSLVVENLEDVLNAAYSLSGKNFDEMYRLLRYFSSANVGEVSSAVKQYGMGGAVATGAAALKQAIDSDNVISIVQIRQSQSAQKRRAKIYALANATGVDPEKVIMLAPDEVLRQFKEKVAIAPTDATTTALRNGIIDGTFTAKSISDLFKPYVGQGKQPLTDAEAMAALINEVVKSSTKVLIKNFNIKPDNMLFRTTKILKDLLSTTVFMLPYLRTNVLNNFATGLFDGVSFTYQNKKVMDNVWKRADMISPDVGSFGIASEIVSSMGLLYEALNPDDVIGKISRFTKKKIVPINLIARSSAKMEKMANQGVLTSQFSTMMERLPGYQLDATDRANLKATGYNDDHIAAIQTGINNAWNGNEIEASMKLSENWKPLALEAMATGVRNLFPDNPGLGNEILNKLGLKDWLMTRFQNVNTPDDIESLRLELSDFMKDKLDAEWARQLPSTLVDAHNIVSKEGVVGMGEVMFEIQLAELENRHLNNELWSDAWKRAYSALDDGNNELYHQIIANTKSDQMESWDRTNAMTLAKLTGALSALNLDDALHHPLVITMQNLYKRRAKYAADLNAEYDKHWAASESGKTPTWEETKKANQEINDAFRKEEMSLENAQWNAFIDTFKGEIRSDISMSGLSTTNLEPLAKELADRIQNGSMVNGKKVDGTNQIKAKITRQYESLLDKTNDNNRRVLQQQFFDLYLEPALAALRDLVQREEYALFHRSKPTQETGVPTPTTAPTDNFQLLQNKVNYYDLKEQQAISARMVKVRGNAAAARNSLIVWGTQVRTTTDFFAQAWANKHKSTLEAWYDRIARKAYNGNPDDFDMLVAEEVKKALGITSFTEIDKVKAPELKQKPLPFKNVEPVVAKTVLELTTEHGEELIKIQQREQAQQKKPAIELAKKVIELRNSTRDEQELLTIDSALIDPLNEIIKAPAKGMPGEVPQADGVKFTSVTEYPMYSTTPVGRNDGDGLMALRGTIHNTANSIIDVMKTMMEQGKTVTAEGVTLTPEGQKTINRIKIRATETTRTNALLARGFANIARERTLLNYSKRRGFDTWLEQYSPYQFWYTRSLLEWTKRMIARPGYVAMAYRYQELLERNALTGLPSRLGGMQPIFINFAPEWLNDMIFVDPMRVLYPPESIFQFVTNFADLNNDVYDDTVKLINKMVEDGVISSDMALETIRNREGDIWTAASSEVLLNMQDDQLDPMSMASFAVQGAPWITMPYYALKGTPEKNYPFGVTKLGQAMRGVDPDGVLGILGTLLATPEEYVREKAGLSPYGINGDYYIDFMLSNLALDGVYDTDIILQAMNERTGEAYDKAVQMTELYLALRTQPGTALYQVIKDGNAQDLLPATLATLFPSGIYPTGEMEARGLSDEYQKAWDDFLVGNTEALNNFFDENPEYEARMALFDDKEERLKQFMISGIWEKYLSMPDANKQMVREQLGSNFINYFINKNTRNYEMIDINTFATWAKQMNVYVPVTDETKVERMVEPLQLYNTNVTAAAQAFIDIRKQTFPDYWWQQKVYWDLPEDKRQEFVNDFPIYENYLNWKEQYLKDNPIVGEWLDDRSARYLDSDLLEQTSILQDEEALTQFDGELVSALMQYVYVGVPLSDGAKAELNRIWTQMGKPGNDFGLWLTAWLGL